VGIEAVVGIIGTALVGTVVTLAGGTLTGGGGGRGCERLHAPTAISAVTRTIRTMRRGWNTARA
jgi:hypothetical protein